MKSFTAVQSQQSFYTGLCLAILSTIFIGSSFIIKKKALIKLNCKGSLRAGAGGFGYLKEWIWWAGLLSMGIGEIFNFVAYAFAPATLVTPLGGLSVLVSSVLASKFLHEKLNFTRKLGCILCILGSIMIVIHSPKEDEVESIEMLLSNLQDSSFLVYIFLVLITFCLIFFYFGPRYGHQNVVVYILLCSSIGSLTVMACKGLGLVIKEAIFAGSDFDHWSASLFAFSVFICVIVQMNYLNKALDLFNTGIVTALYYVLYTILVMIASTILFSEWDSLNANDVIGIICGFSTVIIAIILLNRFKDLDVTMVEIQGNLKNLKQANVFLKGGAKTFLNGDKEYMIKNLEEGAYSLRSSHNL